MSHSLQLVPMKAAVQRSSGHGFGQRAPPMKKHPHGLCWAVASPTNSPYLRSQAMGLISTCKDAPEADERETKNSEARRTQKNGQTPASEKQGIQPQHEPYKGSKTGLDFGIAVCPQIVGQDHTETRGLPLSLWTLCKFSFALSSPSSTCAPADIVHLLLA